MAFPNPASSPSGNAPCAALKAHIIAEGWQALPVTGAEQREIETLAQLAENLPDISVFTAHTSIGVVFQTSSARAINSP